MSLRIQTIIMTGTTGLIVDIECHLSNNLPTIVIVGLANRAVGEARERIRGAFATSHIMLPRKRVTINLAPADIPKADSGFDLAIAAAILTASDQVNIRLTQQYAFIGELGLDGSTRAVRGIIGKLMAGRAAGITTFFIPRANLKQAQLVPHIHLIPLDTLEQCYNYLAGSIRLQPIDTKHGDYSVSKTFRRQTSNQLSEIVGQAQAKRALMISAAGGHNLLLSGPPGTGKSMLAKALALMLPPLNREEMLEVTQLHSLANHNYEDIITSRPFRAPHHSASHVAIIGGNSGLKPGEISLAHRGVLFLDELPEFQRTTLEALRQPLEDQSIELSRSGGTVAYPANFTLIATANPCPCGYFGTSGTTNCRCQPYKILQYQQKLSGPILDRIDLYSSVHEVEHDKLLLQSADPVADAAVRRTIVTARRVQAQRYDSKSKLNADMTNLDIRKHAQLTPAAHVILNAAAHRFTISARAYMRTVKVARTIADLSASDSVTHEHISEALTYRRATHQTAGS